MHAGSSRYISELFTIQKVGCAGRGRCESVLCGESRRIKTYWTWVKKFFARINKSLVNYSIVGNTIQLKPFCGYFKQSQNAKTQEEGSEIRWAQYFLVQLVLLNSWYCSHVCLHISGEIVYSHIDSSWLWWRSCIWTSLFFSRLTSDKSPSFQMSYSKHMDK